MNSSLVAPACLAAPQPVIRVFDGNKRIFPLQAGYVVKPHCDYRLEISVSGVNTEDWTVRHGRKPTFVSNVAISPLDASSKQLKVSTQRASDGWRSLLTDFGSDLPLTISYVDPEIAAQHVAVPLVRGKPWFSLFVFTFTAVSSLGSWLIRERLPESAEQYLPSEWASRLLFLLTITAVLIAMTCVYRWFVQPWCRYQVLKKRAHEKLALASPAAD